MPFSPNIYKPLSGVSKKIFSLSRIRNYRTYNKKLSGEKWIFILRTLAALVKLGIFFLSTIMQHRIGQKKQLCPLPGVSEIYPAGPGCTSSVPLNRRGRCAFHICQGSLSHLFCENPSKGLAFPFILLLPPGASSVGLCGTR